MALARAILCASLLAGHAAAEEFILLQSTTSTAGSGLFDHILPQFTERTGIAVRVVAVGTGQAMTNAKRCDGDVLLVHARAAEDRFVADGFAERRFDVMHNDFVVIGPAADPAGIVGHRDVTAAFAAIAGAQAAFVSRGDDSGAHAAELAIWRAAGIDAKAASGGWYRETGSGMGATINIARGMGGYALTDRATWSSHGDKGDFVIAVEGDPTLLNPYGVMAISPERCPNVKADAGRAFVDWLIGPEGQAAIAGFTIGGERQFFPAAAAARRVGG